MPLSRYALACPLIDPTDIVRFHSDLYVNKDHLHDRRLGLRHELDPRASALLKLLENGTTYDHFLRQAKSHSVSTEQIRDILGFLSTMGGVTIIPRQRFSSGIRRLRYFIHTGYVSPTPYRRRTTGILGILIAVAYASQYVIGGTASLLIIWWLCEFPVFLLYALAYTLCLFIVSLVIHEACHAAQLARYNTRAVVVYNRLRIGILHRTCSPRQEIIATLAGPCGGLACCIVTLLLSHSTNLLFVAGGIVVASLQVCSLLPWYGDGKSLRAALQVIRRSHEATA